MDKRYKCKTEDYYNVDFACLSDIGKIKMSNDDYTCITRNKNDDILMILADGISSHRCGDYGSKTIVDYISKAFGNTKRFLCNFTAKIWLKNKIQEANKMIFQNSKEIGGPSCMGTTVVAALILKKSIIIMNIGDSNAYLFDNKTNSLKLINQSHNYANTFQCSEKEKEYYKHVITNAVGVYPRVSPYCKILKILDCHILLCSDGLTDNVKEDEIIKIICEHTDNASSIVSHLIEKANENGGSDNISVAYFARKKYDR